jgi:RNA polymerase sigma-70 factor, ECF subfamily
VPTREERFNRLYDDHFDAVRGYVWRRDPLLCDEVLAETFLVAWRRLEETPSQARPWLIGIARNVRLNLRRGARRQQALTARLIETASDPGYADRPIHAGPVETALSRLSHKDREILLLSTWDGLDRSEIAQVLGCSRANVNVRLHRARKRLAATLTEESTESAVHPSPIPRGVHDAY